MNKNKIKNALEFLNRFTNYERHLRYPYNGWAMNLERVKVLLENAGSPEKKLKIIHIAGTKGKGSTAKMLQSILTCAGYKTGLFTSPHLIQVNERIQIDGSAITDEELAEAIENLKPAVAKLSQMPKLGELTYFELLTACALWHFAQKKVDFAILEVGLGGRYDATNICQPILAIITSIGYDHTDILGSKLSQIAQEKAMIIKPDAKVIIAPQKDEAWAVLKERIEQMSAKAFPLEKYYSWQVEKITSEKMEVKITGTARQGIFELALLGVHQAINAGLSILACDILSESKFSIPESAIKQGLKKAYLPARFQQVEFWGKKFIIDGAHNPESAQALVDTLERVYPEQGWNFIVGLSQDKDVQGFFAPIKKRAKRIVICQTGISRSAPPEKIYPALADFSGEVIFEPRLKKAVRQLNHLAKKDELIIIAGSFYLAGEALKWMKESGAEIQIP